MNYLVIVRHGQTEWSDRFTGWTDIDIAPAGIEMTKKYALKLKEKGIRFDIGFTSYLKRGIKTLEVYLQILNQESIPVVKDWRLNERHYGALQTLNKPETVVKYGKEQVDNWRRSFDVAPPLLEDDDPRQAKFDPLYKSIDPKLLPNGESLKDAYKRSVPYFKDKILGEIMKNKNVILSGHHNSLRAIVKYLDNVDNEAIIKLNIPYCIPLIYEFSGGDKPLKHYYLASEEEVRVVIDSIKNQTKSSA